MEASQNKSLFTYKNCLPIMNKIFVFSLITPILAVPMNTISNNLPFQFIDKKLCSKFIHELLSVNESICTEIQKITAVKEAWMYGHENELLTDDMYEFGITLLKLENASDEELVKVPIYTNVIKREDLIVC